MVIRTLMLVALLPLAGCSNWLLGETERVPTWQLGLAPAPVSAESDAWPYRLVVLAPQARPQLQATSPLVVAADGSVSVLGGARWADRPAAMLQQALRQRLLASGRFADVATESFEPSQERRLHIALHGFHIEADQNGGLQAIASWTLRLPQQQLRAESIEVRQSVDGRSVRALMRALQDAAAQLIDQGSQAVLELTDEPSNNA
jgi:ABC-type uncharacterized transport system auxiliary subunit